MSIAPVLVPELPDAFPLLLVAVAYSGITAGSRAVAASVAIVAVQALLSTATPGDRVLFSSSALPILVVRLGSAGAIGIMGAMLRERYVRERWALQALNDQLRGIALRDPLTALTNRRGFEEALDREVAVASRGDRHFVLVWADVDGLKNVNDAHGHQAGDAVLESFAHALRVHLRTTDVAARVGGDEFAVILADADAQVAREVMTRVAATYRDLLARRDLPIRTTVSFGVAAYPNDAKTRDALVAGADRRLYAEKGGRRSASA